ncbi:MAG TPA: GTPase HflX [bacterium]|nr:GTPase HflX [bacterium]
MGHRSPYSTDGHEKALLVGVYSSKRERHRQETSLAELTRLTQTAGAEILGSELHELKGVHAATYVGQGKAEALGRSAEGLGAGTVIFDEDLSPTQNRNLETISKRKVIDRTGLILDIFAKRARTREGKLQVELAQLRYLLPRLTGRGTEFSQLAGGIGTRGPGETRLEMDRRKAKVRISLVSRELKRVQAHRELHRTRRSEIPIPTVALVGYTNAGKSTLMNRLTDASVLVEDRLFATLDPTVRRLKLPSGREILLSDTVGFVHKLPHQLVEAFRATFEEVAAADLLIHLIDSSDPEVLHQMETVDRVLEELGLHRKPQIRVFNKVDAARTGEGPVSPHADGLQISALTGEGTENLLMTLEDKLSESFRFVSLTLPYEKGAELSVLYRTSRILNREDRADGVHLEAVVDEKHYNKFKAYQS